MKKIIILLLIFQLLQMLKEVVDMVISLDSEKKKTPPILEEM